MTNKTIGQRILDHANKNYNDNGWDIIAECFSANDIEKWCASWDVDVTDYDACLAEMEMTAKIKDEQRSEIMSTAW